MSQTANPLPLPMHYAEWKDWADALTVWLKNNNLDVSDGLGQTPPIGATLLYSAATVPAGWLECDGASYSEDRYPILYKIQAGAAGVFSVPNSPGYIIRAG